MEPATAALEAPTPAEEAEPRATPNLRIAAHQVSHAHQPVAMALLNQTPQRAWASFMNQQGNQKQEATNHAMRP
jgi:hypothetical protein